MKKQSHFLEEVGERFRRFRENINKAQHELASELGVAQALISKIESGDYQPKLSYLSYFIKKYRLNINWLFSGKGEMYIRDERKSEMYYSKNKEYLEFFKLMQVPVIELLILSKFEETKIILKETIQSYNKYL